MRLSGKYLFAALAVMTAGLWACKDDFYDNSAKGPLELSTSRIDVGRNEVKAGLGVTSRNEGWTVSGTAEWFSVNPASGGIGLTEVSVVFSAYRVDTDAEPRTATLTFTSGENTRTVEITQYATETVPIPDQHADFPVNQTIHGLLKRWYYNGEPATPSATGDYNQNYLSFYKRYLESLKNNSMDGGTWSGQNERYLYSRIERNPIGTSVSGVTPLTYGMEFDLSEYDGKLVGRILYVMAGSPAATTLRRGEWFYKVNDRVMGNWKEEDTGWLQYNRLIDTLVHPVEGERPKLGMLRYTTDFRLQDAGETKTLSSARYTKNPIIYSNSASPITRNPDNGTRTGYLVLSSLDFPSHTPLIEEFRRFKAQNLTHFVLDLRYSMSGTVETAELLGNLLAPPAADGRVFAKYQFYKDAPISEVNNREAKFAAHADGLGLDTIVILTSKNTAGAAELLINGLIGLVDVEETENPLMRVVVVGDTTEGMNVGLVKKTFEHGEWEYSMWIAAFTCTNHQGKDWAGFTPNGGIVQEWNAEFAKRWLPTWGWNGTEGAQEDPLLEKAIDYIWGRTQFPTDAVSGEGNRTRRRSGLMRDFSEPMGMTMSSIPEFDAQ